MSEYRPGYVTVNSDSSTHELPSFIDHPDLQDSDGKPVSSGEKLRRMYEEAVGKHMGRDITREEISDLQNLLLQKKEETE